MKGKYLPCGRNSFYAMSFRNDWFVVAATKYNQDHMELNIIQNNGQNIFGITFGCTYFHSFFEILHLGFIEFTDNL